MDRLNYIEGIQKIVIQKERLRINLSIQKCDQKLFKKRRRKSKKEIIQSVTFRYPTPYFNVFL